MTGYQQLLVRPSHGWDRLQGYSLRKAAKSTFALEISRSVSGVQEEGGVPPAETPARRGQHRSPLSNCCAEAPRLRPYWRRCGGPGGQSDPAIRGVRAWRGGTWPNDKVVEEFVTQAALLSGQCVRIVQDFFLTSQNFSRPPSDPAQSRGSRHLFAVGNFSIRSTKGQDWSLGSLEARLLRQRSEQ